MSNTRPFDAEALLSLSEKTRYEAWLLEAVYALIESEVFHEYPDGVIYPLRGSPPVFCVHGRAHLRIGDWRPGFLAAGAPLIFVSTFKLLDMLVEWIFECQGVKVNFQFEDKIKKLNSDLIFPPAIEARDWLKRGIIALYSSLAPLRGTIIHSRHFTSNDGAIRVSSSKGNIVGPEVEISTTQLRTLAFFSISMLRYVDGSWRINAFRDKLLRWQLDQFAYLHRLPLLGQKDPYQVTVRAFSMAINPAAIQQDLRSQYPQQDTVFDLRVLLVERETVVAAYLFHWDFLESNNFSLANIVDLEHFQVAIPSDVNASHYASND